MDETAAFSPLRPLPFLAAGEASSSLSGPMEPEAPFLPFLGGALASALPRRTSWQMPQARRPSYEPWGKGRAGGAEGAGGWVAWGGRQGRQPHARMATQASNQHQHASMTADQPTDCKTHLGKARVGQILWQLHLALGLRQLIKHSGPHKQEVALAVGAEIDGGRGQVRRQAETRQAEHAPLRPDRNRHAAIEAGTQGGAHRYSAPSL